MLIVIVGNDDELLLSGVMVVKVWLKCRLFITGVNNNLTKSSFVHYHISNHSI